MLPVPPLYAFPHLLFSTALLRLSSPSLILSPHRLLERGECDEIPFTAEDLNLVFDAYRGEGGVVVCALLSYCCVPCEQDTNAISVMSCPCAPASQCLPLCVGSLLTPLTLSSLLSEFVRTLLERYPSLFECGVGRDVDTLPSSLPLLLSPPEPWADTLFEALGGQCVCVHLFSGRVLVRL